MSIFVNKIIALPNSLLYGMSAIVGMVIGLAYFVPLAYPAMFFVVLSSFVFPLGFIVLGNNKQFAKIFDGLLFINLSILFIASTFLVRFFVYGV